MSATVHPQFGPTYGAIFIGAFVSAIFFGVTNLQVFIYFQRYPRDTAWNKLAVCVLWLMDATHLALTMHMIYFYLVINYGRAEVLLDIVWSFKAQIILDSIVVCMVHTLYTIRLWKLTAIDLHISSLSTRGSLDGSPPPDAHTVAASDDGRKLVRRLLPLGVNILVFFGYGAASALCYEITQFHRWIELLNAQWVTYFALGAASGIDVVVASALCYLLARCRTGSQKMDSTITVLMVYTLNTGMLTSLCSLTAIVMMTVFPATFIMIAIELSLTKLYINSFMAMFNARSGLREQDDSRDSHDVDLKSVDPFDSAERKHILRTLHHSASSDDTSMRTPRVSLIPLEVDLGNDLRPLYWPPPDTAGRETPLDTKAAEAADPVTARMPMSPRSWRKPPPDVRSLAYGGDVSPATMRRALFARSDGFERYVYGSPVSVSESGQRLSSVRESSFWGDDDETQRAVSEMSVRAYEGCSFAM